MQPVWNVPFSMHRVRYRGVAMNDVSIQINGQNLKVKQETSILEASQQLGIRIPTLCFSQKANGNSGCMVCVVWDNLARKHLPACKTECLPGMDIVTDSHEINMLRRQTIELLLSEHHGACEALCDIACPQALPLSALVQSISDLPDQLDIEYDPEICEKCQGKCERACRRGRVDHAIPIRRILRERAKKIVGNSKKPPKPPKRYNHLFGKVSAEELKIMVGRSSNPSGESIIEKEAARCLKCDCSAKNNCTLRELATHFQVYRPAFKNENPEPFQIIDAGKIVFEPTKCVRCSRCVSLGEILKPDQGPVMVNRGKHTIIAPPFGMNYQDIFAGFEQEFIDECPTGALYSPVK